MDLPQIDPSSVKSAFEAARAAIDAIKSLRDMFRGDSARHKDASAQIELAERQLQLAEAQIAQALHYPLCRAHFPPVPMLKDRVEAHYVETIYRCPQCSKEEPSPEHFLKKRRQDEYIKLHNEKMATKFGRLR